MPVATSKSKPKAGKQSLLQRKPVSEPQWPGAEAALQFTKKCLPFAIKDFESTIDKWQSEATEWQETPDFMDAVITDNQAYFESRPSVDDGVTAQGYIEMMMAGGLGRLLACGYFGRPERAWLGPVIRRAQFQSMWSTKGIEPALEIIVSEYWTPLLEASKDLAAARKLMSKPSRKLAVAPGMIKATLARVDDQTSRAAFTGLRAVIDEIAEAGLPSVGCAALLAAFAASAKAGELAAAMCGERSDDDCFLVNVAHEAFEEARKAGAPLSASRARAAALALLGVALRSNDCPLRIDWPSDELWLPMRASRWLDMAEASDEEVEARADEWLAESVRHAADMVRLASEEHIRNGMDIPPIDSEIVAKLKKVVPQNGQRYVQHAGATRAWLIGLGARRPDFGRAESLRDQGGRIERALHMELTRSFGMWLHEGAYCQPEAIEARVYLEENGDASLAGFSAAAELADLIWSALLEPLLLATGELTKGDAPALSLGQGHPINELHKRFALARDDLFFRPSGAYIFTAESSVVASSMGCPPAERDSFHGKFPSHAANLFAPWAANEMADYLPGAVFRFIEGAEAASNAPVSIWRDAALGLRDLIKADGMPSLTLRRALALTCVADALNSGQIEFGRLISDVYEASPRLKIIPGRALAMAPGTETILNTVRAVMPEAGVGSLAAAAHHYATHFGQWDAINLPRKAVG